MKKLTDTFQYVRTTINKKEKRPILCFAIVSAFLLFMVSFFDRGLFIGLLLLLVLSGATIFITGRTGIKSKRIYAIFLIALAIHLGVVLFIYYVGFKPFGGGGDYDLYHSVAKEISIRFWKGNFSLAGLYTEHFFPILIGILYTVTLPDMIVGQFFTVWLAAVSILLVYIITLEMGGTKKIALLASLIVSIYPSYLYFGSLLLKDTVIIPLVLAGMLLLLKIFKNFSWVKFLIFFVILTGLINLRFYIGYALMFSFIFSWPFLSVFIMKKRMIYWLMVIFFLGFSPFVLGDGYYGSNNFKRFLNPKSITYYREVVYNSNNSPLNSQPTTTKPTTTKPTTTKPTTTKPTTTKPSITQPSTSQQNPPQQELNGNGSTFAIETGFNGGILAFLKNSSQSFVYSLLGPFPWQFRYQRQIVGLAETIPWYLLIIVSIYGSIRFIIKRGILEFLKFHRFTLPLLMFSVLAIGALCLFVNNYGIIARIRIPVFICFFSMMFISFNDPTENYVKKLYEKISHNWRRWIYRLSSIRGAFKPGK